MNHNAKTVVVGVFIFFISVRSFTHSLANPRVALTHSPSAYARLVLALTSWSTLTTGGLRILKVRWKTFSIMPLRLTQSMDPTRTLSPTITLRLIFFSSALTTQSISTPRKLPEGSSFSGTMTRMKLACDAATTPMAWDSVRGGLASRERTGAREENSFSVCFAFRRLRLGGACLLGFCCWCLAAIRRQRKRRRRRRGAAEAAARCRSIENDDANDMENRKMEQMNH